MYYKEILRKMLGKSWDVLETYLEYIRHMRRPKCPQSFLKIGGYLKISKISFKFRYFLQTSTSFI